jgi:hypothetical protein
MPSVLGARLGSASSTTAPRPVTTTPHGHLHDLIPDPRSHLPMFAMPLFGSTPQPPLLLRDPDVCPKTMSSLPLPALLELVHAIAHLQGTLCAFFVRSDDRNGIALPRQNTRGLLIKAHMYPHV